MVSCLGLKEREEGIGGKGKGRGQEGRWLKVVGLYGVKASGVGFRV